MKKLLFVTLALSTLLSVQTTTSFGKNPDDKKKKETTATANSDYFNATNFTLVDHVVTLTNIPSDRRVRAYISNTDGDTQISKHITAQNNTIDVSGLKKGMYFLTLMAGDYRKGYTLTIE